MVQEDEAKQAFDSVLRNLIMLYGGDSLGRRISPMPFGGGGALKLTDPLRSN